MCRPTDLLSVGGKHHSWHLPSLMGRTAAAAPRSFRQLPVQTGSQRLANPTQPAVPPVRTRPREDVFFTDFLCFAEDQQKAARSSAGWNECPGEPTTLLDREMTRNTAMRSLKSISASMSGYTTDFYQGGRRSELVADKKIRVSIFRAVTPFGGAA